jgi:hypothetical protein
MFSYSGRLQTCKSTKILTSVFHHHSTFSCIFSYYYMTAQSQNNRSKKRDPFLCNMVNMFLWQQINMQQWRNYGCSVFCPVQATAIVKTPSWVKPILSCIVRRHYQAIINEDIGDSEDLVFAIVICSVCWSVKLLIGKSYKHSINPVINQNPVSSPWLMTAGVRNGIGLDCWTYFIVHRWIGTYMTDNHGRLGTSGSHHGKSGSQDRGQLRNESRSRKDRG